MRSSVIERERSPLRRGGDDQDFACFWLIAHAGSADFRFLGFRGLDALIGLVTLAVATTVLGTATVGLLPTLLRALLHTVLSWGLSGGLSGGLSLRLVLLCRLVHGIQDAEIMFRVLEVTLSHHPIAAAGRVASKLQVLFEQLLRRATQPNVWPIAVENVIAVQWNTATRIVPDGLGATTPTPAPAATTARAMIAATHALHVHVSAVVLSRCGRAWGVLGQNRPKIACPWEHFPPSWPRYPPTLVLAGAWAHKIGRTPGFGHLAANRAIRNTVTARWLPANG